MTPKEFFENTLPSLFKGVAGGQPELQQITGEMEIVLPEGGTWTLALDKGNLITKEAAATNPIVSFTLSRRDWDRLMQGGSFMPIGAAPGGGANPFKMSPARFEKVKMLKGELVFHITEPGGEAQDTVIRFNPKQGTGPRTELEMNSGDLKDLSEGKANPQQLFMQGKMRIKGDMAFAMQIGSLAMMA
ncbi:MAG: SCP2 sterol-binding domain-containing protein [Nitrospirae bacterium]|nr:SCP2 sterol-binding domain-containing protein [Nitrospirota bacterium]